MNKNYSNYLIIYCKLIKVIPNKEVNKTSTAYNIIWINMSELLNDLM